MNLHKRLYILICMTEHSFDNRKSRFIGYDVTVQF